MPSVPSPIVHALGSCSVLPACRFHGRLLYPNFSSSCHCSQRSCRGRSLKPNFSQNMEVEPCTCNILLDASSEHSEARLSEPASAPKWNVLPRSLSKPALPENRMFCPRLLYTEIDSHVNQILLCYLPSMNARRGSSRILLSLYIFHPLF